MFDIGWPELMLIAVITVLVVGPKELPRVLRSFTMWVRRIREMASEFQSGLDDLAREAELEEIQNELRDASPTHLVEDFENSIESELDVGEEFDDIQDSIEDKTGSGRNRGRAGEAGSGKETAADGGERAVDEPSESGSVSRSDDTGKPSERSGGGTS